MWGQADAGYHRLGQFQVALSKTFCYVLALNQQYNNAEKEFKYVAILVYNLLVS